jgi:glutathione S-transferase
MHSSFTSLRSELPMNCRKKFPGFTLSDAVQADVQRIKSIWKKCFAEHSANGAWLFGDFSIADAMFAPVVLRFASYAVPLDEMETSYLQTVLNDPHIVEWLASAKQEKEVIVSEEVSV